MENRILEVQLADRSLDPLAAEIVVRVRPVTLTPATQLRGRLMGPSCPYSNTIEIAFPLLPLPSEEGWLRARVPIVEANLWDPQHPFLYAGPVELWDDGQLCERKLVRRGLRQIVQDERGLRINGKPIILKERDVERLDEQSASQLRGEGINLLRVPLRADTLHVWHEAERWGFLVLGTADKDGPQFAEADACASRLGWRDAL